MKSYGSWDKILEEEYNKVYFKKLTSFLEDEYSSKVIYPPKDKVFNAFSLTPYDEVRVVILGQDPYINPNQAEGLAFSVQEGNKLPPSLRNIFKLLNIDLGIDRINPSLVNWAKQGVLLLNATLTVREGKSMSHKGKGWEKFIDNIIKAVNEKDTPVLFVLWGNNAKQKASLITNPIHEVIESVHPSPLSCYGGFFESRHFALIEDFLHRHGYDEIDFS